MINQLQHSCVASLSRLKTTSSQAELIKSLRQQTGAPISDVARALYECSNDFDTAFTILRKKGLAAAQKKASRAATEGSVALRHHSSNTNPAQPAYFSTTYTTTSIAEINCETDFASRTSKFASTASLVAHTVAAPQSSKTTHAYYNGDVSMFELDQQHINSLTVPNDDNNDNEGKGESITVEQMLSELAGEVRENVIARRAFAVQLFNASSDAVVGSYVHAPSHPGVGQLASVVALRTGKEGSSDDVKPFADKIAMHIAASSPSYTSRADVPESDVEHEKSVLREQAPADKPEHVVEKIVSGKLSKFYESHCLLEQDFVVEENVGSVGDVLQSRFPGSSVITFKRMKVGEGKESDRSSKAFIDDVKEMMDDKSNDASHANH